MTSANKPPFFWHNGNIEKTLENHIEPFVSSFSSVTISETIITRGTEIMFFDETLSKLNYLSRIYNIQPTLLSGIKGENLKSEVKRTLIRNKYYNTARCKIIFNYKPLSEKINEFILIEPDPLLFRPQKFVPSLFIATGISKPDGLAMRLPTLENEFRKLLIHEMHTMGTDDCLILNQRQGIVEAFSGNIFLASNQKITTPSLASGCTRHVTRQFVIDRLQSLGYSVSEKDFISAQDIFACSELFTAGIYGIFAVKGIENKRYFDKIRKELLKSLEENS
ncbi:MAG: aminotransferase class IV [Prolixibacteraceae bacterium]|nr:aminotransferase class IV [Prolixibacteraceae bacterium]